MNKPLLEKYAQALFSLGREKDKVSSYGKGLHLCAEVLSSDPKSLKFFSSPMVEKEEKSKVLEESFKDRVDPALLGFLHVLIRRKVIRFIAFIDESYQHLIHQEEGILEGRIYTSYPLSEKTKAQVEEIFSKKYGRKVVFKVLIDKRTLAGMKIYLNDTLYDYSLDTKLNRIQEHLITSK